MSRLGMLQDLCPSPHTSISIGRTSSRQFGGIAYRISRRSTGNRTMEVSAFTRRARSLHRADTRLRLADSIAVVLQQRGQILQDDESWRSIRSCEAVATPISTRVVWRSRFRAHGIATTYGPHADSLSRQPCAKSGLTDPAALSRQDDWLHVSIPMRAKV